MKQKNFFLKLFSCFAIFLIAISPSISSNFVNNFPFSFLYDGTENVVLKMDDSENVELAVDTMDAIATDLLNYNSYMIHKPSSPEEVKRIISWSKGRYNVIVVGHGDRDLGLRYQDGFLPWEDIISHTLTNEETLVALIS